LPKGGRRTDLMKKPKLVVTSHFIKPVETRIDSEYEVRRIVDGTLFTRDELPTAAEGADAMLITPFDRLDAEFFKRVSPSVKVISTNSVGFDHIDMQAAASASSPGLADHRQDAGDSRYGGASDRLLQNAPEPLG
jgi:phosphoglycerate dehydrogenase-like enzyme